MRGWKVQNCIRQTEEGRCGSNAEILESQAVDVGGKLGQGPACLCLPRGETTVHCSERDRDDDGVVEDTCSRNRLRRHPPVDRYHLIGPRARSGDACSGAARATGCA
jgi:hypothetical protein